MPPAGSRVRRLPIVPILSIRPDIVIQKKLHNTNVSIRRSNMQLKHENSANHHPNHTIY